MNVYVNLCDVYINLQLFTKKYYFQTLQAFLPNMIEKNHGHIVAVASLAAFIPGKQVTIYCTTKTAVSGT